MNRLIIYPLIGAAELWCQLSCHLSSLSRHESRIESVISSVQGVSDSNWAKDTSSQEGDFLFALCKSYLEARYFGSSLLWKLVTTKAFRAALCIHSSNVYTIGEARSRLYRRFCIICCVLFSVDLFHLISTTVSNNRFYFWGAPLQQQTELQLLFGCCQQQAERLVDRFR